MPTGYEVKMYADIASIADSLRTIAKASTPVATSVDVSVALANAKQALAGDSCDAERSALYDLVATLEESA